jgi:hypothetical protein
VNPSVDRVVHATEDSVVDNPEYIACAPIENIAEVMDRSESKAGGTNAISCVENIARVASVTQQQVTNVITDDASHASVASKVVDMEIANEGKVADVFAFCLSLLLKITCMYMCARVSARTRADTRIWWHDNRCYSLAWHVQFYFRLSLFIVAICE